MEIKTIKEEIFFSRIELATLRDIEAQKIWVNFDNKGVIQRFLDLKLITLDEYPDCKIPKITDRGLRLLENYKILNINIKVCLSQQEIEALKECAEDGKNEWGFYDVLYENGLVDFHFNVTNLGRKVLEHCL